MAKSKSKRSYEDMLAELETVIANMERGDLPLDELLRQHEVGMGLLRSCRERLHAAEQAISAEQVPEAAAEQEGLWPETRK